MNSAGGGISGYCTFTGNGYSGRIGPYSATFGY